MACDVRSAFLASLAICALACSADDNSGGPPSGSLFDAGTTIPSAVTADSGAPAPVTMPTNDAGSTPVTQPVDSGSGSSAQDSAVAVVDSAVPATDSGASGVDSGAADSGASGGTSLTGMYGSLGAVKPVVNSIWISTGLETIIYLSSTPLTCAQVMTEGGRWLLMLPSDGQVLEIVTRGAAKTGTFKIPSAEANYAQGGKSSATEKGASSGTLTITKVEAMSAIEGTVMATYSSGSVMGTFRAEYCAGGQEW